MCTQTENLIVNLLYKFVSAQNKQKQEKKKKKIYCVRIVKDSKISTSIQTIYTVRYRAKALMGKSLHVHQK